MDLLTAIPIILIAVVLHEAWGHKLIAEKVLGLKPMFIAIGIPITKEFKPRTICLPFIGEVKIPGKKINSVFFTWNRPGKIPVVFSWLMIGGGVGFEDKAYYSVGKYWQKVLMLLAGPAANLIISFLVISIFTNPVLGINIVWSYSWVTWELIKSIFTKVTVEQILGTHMFFELTLQLKMATVYWRFLAYFALWNVSLGIVNLLPIPGLDGGQIVGTTIINLVGEKAIAPVKLTSAVFSYLLIVVSTIAILWWIGVTIFNAILLLL